MTKGALYRHKATRKDNKFALEMPSYGHTRHFGVKGLRDRTLVKNPTELEEAWEN